MFERLKKAVKNWMQRAGADTGMAKEFKDIFDVGGVPAFNQFYYFGIFVWKWLYKGYYKAWHSVAAPTIANPYGTRDMERMDIAKAICAEMAGLVWSEQCEVHVSQGNGEEQPLDDFVHDVLAKNNFWCKMQENIEQAMALGGAAIKVWYEERHDSQGNVVPDSGHIALGFCMADQFVPTAWDNAKVTDGVFISRQAKDGYYYTRLEWHKWDGLTYWVSNELYRTEQPKDANEPQDILGFRYPLESVYPFLNDNTPMQGLQQSLFAYYRPAQANNIDDNSPLGVSIYANALSTLKALDICYDSFIREFTLGKKRIIVPAQCIRTVVDTQTGNMPYFYYANGDPKEISGTVVTARKVDRSTGNQTWEWGWYVCVKLDAAQTPDAVNYLYFCHCACLLVKVGQKVKSGDALAIMGNTGNAVYNVPPYKHCHLEARATATGRGLDPTAYAGVPNKAGTYGNTDPLPLPAAGRLQIIYLDKLTRGDADAILLCCVGRKLTDAGLYTSKWDDDGHTTQSIIIGPVSQGDADAILATAHARELDKQGLYRSVWADEQEG